MWDDETLSVTQTGEQVERASLACLVQEDHSVDEADKHRPKNNFEPTVSLFVVSEVMCRPDDLCAQHPTPCVISKVDGHSRPGLGR
jgi:hypothetical protein